MRRVLGLWIVGWLAIGALDLGLGLNNGAPHEILTLAVLTDLAFIVVGSFVIVFVYGSSRLIDRVSERTLATIVIVAFVVGGAALILLPGVAVVLGVAFAMFAICFGAIRLVPALMAGRRRGERPDQEAAARNARRDALFASAARRTGGPPTDAADDDQVS